MIILGKRTRCPEVVQQLKKEGFLKKENNQKTKNCNPQINNKNKAC